MKRLTRAIDVRVMPNEKYMRVNLILDNDVYAMSPGQALEIANWLADAAEALDQETPR